MAENGMRSRVRRNSQALRTGDLIMVSPKASGSAFALSNGVHFPIRDQNDNIVFCRVNYEVLAELDGREPNISPDEALRIFHAHRTLIECSATELHALGLRVVIVTTARLHKSSS